VFAGPEARFPREPAALSRYTGVMRYTIADLVERSGLSARTIRSYIQLKFLDPPQGVGRAATYSEAQLLDVTMIRRMRGEGDGWGEVIDRVAGWSLEDKRAWVESAEALERDAAGTLAPAGAGGPAPAEVAPAAAEIDEAPAAIAAPVAEGAEGLPAGPSYVVASLVAGLALVLRHDASPLARRMAREIVATYAAVR
jgi:DNA-binding transcriptional MerR regulator